MANYDLEPPKRNMRQPQPEQKQARANIKSSKHIPFYRKSKYYARGAIDLPFFIIVIALMCIGVLMLFSASYPYALQNKDNSLHFFVRQFGIGLAGIVAMLIISRIDYRILFKRPVYIFIAGLTVFLLVLVLFYYVDLDRSGEDFKRWIPLGPITFQPSDLAKFTLVLLLAVYMKKARKEMKSIIFGVLIPFAIILPIAFLIYKENHLSCTLLILMIGVAMMFVGGTKWQWFALGVGVVLAIAIIVVKNPNVLSEYQAKRIISWKDKTYEPLNARWQVNNSLYAIGSGNFLGVGLGNSKQKFLYVSEPQNDFIFAIVCEELGFIGATAIIFLFGLLFYQGTRIATRCEDRFGSLLVMGIISQVALQTIFNILVVTDTIPNTGISLPFFSYGGTALLILCMEMGVVLSVSRRANTLKV